MIESCYFSHDWRGLCKNWRQNFVDFGSGDLDRFKVDREMIAIELALKNKIKQFFFNSSDRLGDRENQKKKIVW